MGIYRGLAPLKAYKGDMQPVNVYKGSTKVAGWHSASYSGTSPLTVDCDYNVPPDALVIDGRCVQTGTPSPDSPAPISTITGNVIITGADGASSDTATVAFGSAVCASVPDGTHDSYDAVTGLLTKRVGKVVFDGSADEAWNLSTFLTSVNRFYITVSNAIERDSFGADEYISDYFCSISTSGSDSGLVGIAFTSLLRLLVNTSLSLNLTTVAAWRAWLADNPVTIYYKLATPTTVQLTPHLPVVRTGIKTLSVGADVAPTLSATVKSMD